MLGPFCLQEFRFHLSIKLVSSPLLLFVRERENREACGFIECQGEGGERVGGN